MASSTLHRLSELRNVLYMSLLQSNEWPIKSLSIDQAESMTSPIAVSLTTPVMRGCHHQLVLEGDPTRYFAWRVCTSNLIISMLMHRGL